MSFNRKLRTRAIALAVAVCVLGHVGGGETVRETLSDGTVITRFNSIIIYISCIKGTISQNINQTISQNIFTASGVTVVSQDFVCSLLKRHAGGVQQDQQRTLNLTLEGYFNNKYINFKIIEFTDVKSGILVVAEPDILGTKKILNKLIATHSGGKLEILVMGDGEFWYYPVNQTH